MKKKFFALAVLLCFIVGSIFAVSLDGVSVEILHRGNTTTNARISLVNSNPEQRTVIIEYTVITIVASPGSERGVPPTTRKSAPMRKSFLLAGGERTTGQISVGGSIADLKIVRVY